MRLVESVHANVARTHPSHLAATGQHRIFVGEGEEGDVEERQRECYHERWESPRMMGLCGKRVVANAERIAGIRLQLIVFLGHIRILCCPAQIAAK